jgi:tetratricopeptide (TPR) repeat protein
MLRVTLAALALAATTALPARANTLRDPAWQAMLEEGRSADLAAAAQARLKAVPAEPQATLALGLALLALGQPSGADTAAPAAEACVARHPSAAECHYMLGLARGAQAMRAGMLSALRMAGGIREAFERAVELAPDAYAHRAALMQFHLAAPAIAGGGSAKAEALVRATEARQPQQARALRAMQLLADKKLDEAEQQLWAIQPGADDSLRAASYQLLGQVAERRLEAQQATQAQALFERLARREPDLALPVYGLGRAKAEAGAPQDAVKLYAQARSLRGHASLPIDYREALAWLQIGDLAKARALLRRFVDAGRGHPRYLEDAKDRLAKLG